MEKLTTMNDKEIRRLRVIGRITVGAVSKIRAAAMPGLARAPPKRRRGLVSGRRGKPGKPYFGGGDGIAVHPKARSRQAVFGGGAPKRALYRAFSSFLCRSSSYGAMNVTQGVTFLICFGTYNNRGKAKILLGDMADAKADFEKRPFSELKMPDEFKDGGGKGRE